MTLRTKIAVALAVMHLVLVALCFGAAIQRPERSGLAPLFVFFADMPASFIIEPIRHALDAASHSYTGRLLVDAAVYSEIAGFPIVQDEEWELFALAGNVGKALIFF